jgi:hypothetical protein
MDKSVDRIIQEALAKVSREDSVCRICKVDEDRQLVFGWASVCSIDGEDVIDKQGDIIPEHELENAVYEYNLYFRKQGEMHEVMGIGRLVESIVFTVEKQRAIETGLRESGINAHLDLGMVGWFVGFKVDDARVWKRIRAGELPEFSIGGKAIRDEV